MSGKIWDVEWYNQNAQRNYPFVDSATRLDTSGSFTIPNDFIVDFYLSTHVFSVDPANFHISAISAFSHGFVVTVGYFNGDESEVVGSLSVLTASHSENLSYSFNGIPSSDKFFDATGTIVIGSLSNILRYAGAYSFDVASTRLNPARISLDVRAVTGVRVQNAGAAPSELLQGDIVLRAGNNIEFSVEEGDGESGPIIYISAAGNNQYIEECDCDGTTLGEPILSINGVEPDVNGNITLEADSENQCLSVTAGAASTIVLKDTCCEPCCGCDDLEVVTHAVKDVQTQLIALDRYALTLDRAIDQLKVILAVVNTGDLE